MLAERGILGLLWVDEALEITARYGKLVAFAEIGEPLTSELLPLMGLETEIKALRDEQGATLEMPAVTMAMLPGPVPKSNISVFWCQNEGSYLVLLTPHSDNAGLELELSRQIRARLMAESESKHKSEELEQANGELARVNRELEEFASIISHDLKAPMRHMRYMIDDIEQLLGDVIPEEAIEKLDAVRRQSKRMSGMLTALLDYASAGRKEEVSETVDTRALVSSILQSINVPEQFTIEITGEWPEIVTYAAPLDLVLRNLIDNALKHHDRPNGTIQLHCAEEEDALRVRVEDDGPGIPPNLHGSIFAPFRRIGPENSDGHGMGLAFVKKCVDAAGGKLEVRSDCGQKRGTAFLLRWPKL